MNIIETLKPSTQNIAKELASRYPNQKEFRTATIIETAKSLGYRYGDWKDLISAEYRIRRGTFDLAGIVVALEPETTTVDLPNSVVGMQSIVNEEKNFAEVDPSFVAWGAFSDIKKILQSNMFYPTYISGLSGNGKTFMIEQACAKLKREFIRVQINPETDEDDLIGGFRLVNGETVFSKGPVLKAMENGAILLLDEIDRATNKIMCLQGILEGKPVLVKKTGEIVKPAKGFNVIATANTKGKGSEDGRYSGATIIDDAFLERFTITLEQTFPTIATEEKIVMKHMSKFESIDEEFAKLLVGWADAIRKTFYDEGIDEVISTRRLCHIVQTFSIFGKREKAIALCVNRFDDDTKEAFIDLYEKVDATINNPEEVEMDLDGEPNFKDNNNWEDE